MLFWLVALSLSTATAGDVSQRPPHVLNVVVVDQTDAVVPGATITVTPVDPPGGQPLHSVSDGRGETLFSTVDAGAVSVTVELAGFDTYRIQRLVFSRPTTRIRIRLNVSGQREAVTVRRDPRDVSTDRRGDAFSTVLSPLQLAQLSDDPEILRRQLEQMAGPGAVFRIDGFRGGRFPTKDEIARIRIVWNSFAAEFHEGGVPMVEVTTKPGAGVLNLAFSARAQPALLSADSALATIPEAGSQISAYVSIGGPVRRERSSFQVFAEAGRSTTPVPVTAADIAPEGVPPKMTTRRLTALARFDQKLGANWNLRGQFDQRMSDTENLGVGALDLPERAYRGEDVRRSLAVSSGGPLGRVAFTEMRARLTYATNRSTPVSSDPAVIVSGAMRRGGAQVEGNREHLSFEFAQDVDVPWHQHAFRFGVEVGHDQITGKDLTNRGGTFVFPSMDAWVRGIPSVFTQRVGDPAIDVSGTQFGFYLQDDVRIRKGLSVSAGIRQEWQASVGNSWHLAPRVGLAWSPFADGGTTFTMAYGQYYAWIPMATLETVARLDGRHLRELLVLNPGFPDPMGISGLTASVSRYQLSHVIDLPISRLASVAVQQSLAGGLNLRAAYERGDGSRELRGDNLNAPSVAGIRPYPTVGNIVQVESLSRSTSDTLRFALSGRIPRIGVTLVGNYAFRRRLNESDGALDLPADPAHPEREWGPSSDDVRHAGTVLAVFEWRSRLFVSSMISGSSGRPYTVTTGSDGNGDGVMNDRPSGVARNTRRQPGQWLMQVHVALNVGSAGVGASSDGAGRMAGGRIPRVRRPSLQVFVDVQNALNAPGWSGYSGVTASPLFGRPTSALPPRRIECGFTVRY